MPDFIEATCVACLSCETVGERLGEVVSVPHPGGRIPQGDSGCIQQARVGVAEDMPPHAGAVERAEGFGEGTEGGRVGAANRKIQARDDFPRSLAEGNYAEALRCLRGVHPASPMHRAADAYDAALYVAWLKSDDLPPTETRQEDELGDGAMHARHTLDDILDVLEAEGVLTGSRLRDTCAPRRKR